MTKKHMRKILLDVVAEYIDEAFENEDPEAIAMGEKERLSDFAEYVGTLYLITE